MKRTGGANPTPLYEGQCIVGESGIPLVAASIKRKGKRRGIGWRAAEVRCGHAMDGGLQEIVASLLPAAMANGQYVVHAHPAILADPDRMGALGIILPGHRFVSLAQQPAAEGNIVLTVPSASDVPALEKVAPAKPTYTPTFFRV
jgi:hypothetical protein